MEKRDKTRRDESRTIPRRKDGNEELELSIGWRDVNKKLDLDRNHVVTLISG